MVRDVFVKKRYEMTNKSQEIQYSTAIYVSRLRNSIHTNNKWWGIDNVLRLPGSTVCLALTGDSKDQSTSKEYAKR